MVIPIIEERVIVTKGLVLVEEVREPQSVKLRREEVVYIMTLKIETTSKFACERR